MRSTILADYPGYTIYEDGSVISHHTNLAMTFRTHDGYRRAKLVCSDRIKRNVKLHRLLALAFIPNPDNKPLVDHKNRNPLNNDLSNLRWATYSENRQNETPQVGRTSKFTGVSWANKEKPWRACIKIDRKKIHLGYFKTEDEAGEAYRSAKLVYHTVTS